MLNAIGHTLKGWCCYFIGVLMIKGVCAGTLINADIDYDDGRFIAKYHVLIDADVVAVQQLLADYNHLDRLSPLIEQSQLIRQVTKDLLDLRLVLRACVLGICRRYIKIQQLHLISPQSIKSKIISENSDFASGQEHWLIIEHDEGTEILYKAEVEPKFYIPPIIGPLFVKYLIRKELDDTVKQLERLSQPP